MVVDNTTITFIHESNPSSRSYLEQNLKTHDLKRELQEKQGAKGQTKMCICWYPHQNIVS